MVFTHGKWTSGKEIPLASYDIAKSSKVYVPYMYVEKGFSNTECNMGTMNTPIRVVVLLCSVLSIKGQMYMYMFRYSQATTRTFKCVQEETKNIGGVSAYVLDRTEDATEVGNLEPHVLNNHITHLSLQKTPIHDINTVYLKVFNAERCEWTPNKLQLSSGSQENNFICDESSEFTQFHENGEKWIGRHRRSTRSLRVEVSTSDDFQSGSDAKKFILLYGSKKNAPEQRLQGSYKTSDKDTTNIQIEDIGRIEKIRLRHDNNANWYPNWKVSKVLIYEGGRLIGEFYCDCWMDEGRGSLEATVENSIPFCTAASGECGENGVCHKDEKCLCDNSYTGDYCDKPPCTESGGECGDWGTCKTGGSANTCDCSFGYTGVLCDEAPCDPSGSPSQCGGGNGVCKNLGDGTRCHCTNNYEGDYCEKAPCSASGTECGANGYCYEDTMTDVNSCVCTGNYTDTFCTTPPCVEGDSTCGLHGECEREGDTNQCVCRDGYSGYLCQTAPCSVTVAAFGLRDGCGEHGQCQDLGRGDMCYCTDQYTGHLCQTAPCQLEGEECGRHGNCHLDNDLYFCVCSNNYNGTFCDEPPCVEGDSTCGLHGECEREGDTNQCVCRDGYSGYLCQTAACVPDADDAVCGTHGECKDLGTGPMCQCHVDYSGPFCENATHICTTEGGECGDNGVCGTDEGGASMCVCSHYYTGSLCDTPPCSVDGEECGEHGECVAIGDTLTCQCFDNYSGANCSTPACTYDGDECGLHGICDTNVTSSVTNSSVPLCVCDQPYIGIHCQEAMVCTPSGGECLNGGQCQSEEPRPFCLCPSTHTGATCHQKKQFPMKSSADYAMIPLHIVFTISLMGLILSQ